MDLRLEKIDLLSLIGVPQANAESFHFVSRLDDATLSKLCVPDEAALCPESTARGEALTYISSGTDLLAVGMTIGPFSLATRLMQDPVTASGLFGAGMGGDEAVEVRLLEQCLRVAEAAVLRSLRSQVEQDAKAVMVCEPAASSAFISPRQVKAGSDIFERLVMEPNLRLKAFLDKAGVDLIFHNCGELTPQMVEAFAHRLRPVILSLGSSRRLWEDAELVPKDVVLYGNLPSKSFYSDAVMPVEEVERRIEELVRKMRQCGHPHIAGTECDVLFVPGAEEPIRQKVDAILTAGVTT